MLYKYTCFHAYLLFLLAIKLVLNDSKFRHKKSFTHDYFCSEFLQCTQGISGSDHLECRRMSK